MSRAALTRPQAPLRRVILCDATGHPEGTAEIVAAHSGEGQLHLAFSIYLFSPDYSSLLIQRRSAAKTLWPLVWANTCCSHPREGKTAVEAGEQRLQEELGITCNLKPGPEFVYRAVDPNGRGVEHEYDVILTGIFEGDPKPDAAEVAEWKWIELDKLKLEMQQSADSFAPWFHLGLPKVLDSIKRRPSPQKL
jgi:isopentenyl-diphosphate delta-isomerase